jgi:hypothetical protein
MTPEETIGEEGETTGAPATGAAPKTFTQDELDKTIKDRLARQSQKLREEAGQTVADLQAQIAERDERLKVIDDAGKTELQRLQDAADAEKLRADTAAAEKVAADERSSAAETRALVSEVIGEKAPTLPRAYRQLVTGTTREEIEASVIEAQAEYSNDHPEAPPTSRGGGTTAGEGNVPKPGEKPTYNPDGGITAFAQMASGQK